MTYIIPEPPFVNVYGKVKVVGMRNPSVAVLHTTEGWNTIEGLAEFFSHGVLGSSYAVEPNGRLGRFAHINDETQHVEKHNGIAAGIEQINWHTTTRHDWMTKFIWQIRGSAWILGWLSERSNIPLHLCAHNRQWIYKSGVCQHMDIPDNDHNDCGPGYPFDEVMLRAHNYRYHGIPQSVITHLTALRRK